MSDIRRALALTIRHADEALAGIADVAEEPDEQDLAVADLVMERFVVEERSS